jgi:hypothetical protein
MGTKSLVLDGAEIIRSINFVPHLKNSKKIKKNINFDLQCYFIMKIMFNGLNRPFELSNLTDAKHERFFAIASFSIYIYRNM